MKIKYWKHLLVLIIIGVIIYTYLFAVTHQKIEVSNKENSSFGNNGLNDNYLNITASTTTITTGSPTYFPWSYQTLYTDVTFTVTTIAGAPVSDARVTLTLNGDSLGLGAFSTTNSSLWEPSSSFGTTNKYGNGKVILSIPQTSGTITATASKNGYHNGSITLSAELYCFSSNSETSNKNMSLSEAMKIITEKIVTDIEFGNQGKIRDAHIYSCMTDTWWIDMMPTIEKPGCYPAYVVNVITKEVEINWRCTGGILSKT